MQGYNDKISKYIGACEKDCSQTIMLRFYYLRASASKTMRCGMGAWAANNRGAPLDLVGGLKLAGHAVV